MEVENTPTKNPGRVAWGKKLAQMSKDLKAKKKNEEINLIETDIKIDKQTEAKLNLHHIEMLIGIGGLAVAVIALYFQYKQTQKPVSNNNNNYNPLYYPAMK